MFFEFVVILSDQNSLPLNLPLAENKGFFLEYLGMTFPASVIYVSKRTCAKSNKWTKNNQNVMHIFSIFFCTKFGGAPSLKKQVVGTLSLLG